MKRDTQRDIQPPPPGFLMCSYAQAALLLSIGIVTLRNMVKAGKIQKSPIRGKLSRFALEAFANTATP